MPMTNAIVGVDVADAKRAEQRPVIPTG